MLQRITTKSDGKISKKARVYTRDEHRIQSDQVDRDALWVVRRLTGAGYKAYIVGGAVRDMLLGKSPKDFDVATDASPSRIRKVFRRSRVIGRRFRLVHVYFSDGKTLEVSTFRGAGEDNENIFGSLAEDVMRRDFSLNALFYCPLKQQLIDYVDGFKDIKNRKLRILTPPRISFREDPVRIIRAIKYAAPNGFTIPFRLRWSMRHHGAKLLDCSRERLTEEFFKILASGSSRVIMGEARKYGLMGVLWPALPADDGAWDESPLARRLGELDSRVDAGQNISRGRAVAVFYLDVVDAGEHDNTILAIQELLKNAAAPLMLSNRDSREAAHILQKPPPEKTSKRKRRRRRRGTETPAQADQRSVDMRVKSESTFVP